LNNEIDWFGDCYVTHLHLPERAQERTLEIVRKLGLSASKKREAHQYILLASSFTLQGVYHSSGTSLNLNLKHRQ